MRQLPSFHVGRCNVTEFDDGSMNFEFSGIIGFEPLVRVFKMSDASPAPMLLDLENINFEINFGVFPKIVCNFKMVPIISSCIDLITRSAQ